MTLLQAATDLQVRLEAASIADAGDELLARGRTVREAIASAAKHFEAVQSYRVAIDCTSNPQLDARAIRQAIGNFRGSFRRSGPKAVQQQSADKLQNVVDAQTKGVDRWVNATWRENFSVAKDLLKRAEAGDLHGSATARSRVRKLLSTIEAVLNMNPVRDRAALEARLNAEGVDSCLERVNELIGALEAAIAAIDQEQAAMTTAVRSALGRATSDEGLPLGEVTPELLAALQAAGVLDDLVVRQL